MSTSVALVPRAQLARDLDRAKTTFAALATPGVSVGVVIQRVAAMPIMQQVAAEPGGVGRVMQCIATIVQLGLEPGPMREVDILPFKKNVNNNGTWESFTELVVNPTYNGLVKLATNTDIISHITTFVVREGDRIVDRRGTNPTLEFEPAYQPDAKPTRWYAVVHYKNGNVDWECMTAEQIKGVATTVKYDKVQKKKVPKVNEIWEKGGDQADEFGRAKVIRRLAKRLPKDSRFAMAMAMADANDAGRAHVEFGDGDHIVDIVPEVEEQEVAEEVAAPEQAPVASAISKRRNAVKKEAPVVDADYKEAAPAEAAPPAPAKEPSAVESAEAARKYIAGRGLEVVDVQDHLHVDDLVEYASTLGDAAFREAIKKACGEMLEAHPEANGVDA